MKPLATTLVFFSLFSLLSSCGPQQSGTTVDASLKGVGLIATQDAAFYTEVGESVTWTQALDFGTVIKLKGDGQSKTYVVAGRSLSLIPVELDSSLSGWVTEGVIAGEGAEPAAVKVATPVLDREGGAVLVTLPRGTPVAVTRGTSSNGYLVAHVMDVGRGKLYPKAFIKEADITFDLKDVKAAITLNKVAVLRDEEEKQALLKEAVLAFADSQFAPELNAAMGKTPEVPAGPALEALSATLTVAEAADLYQDPDGASPVTRTLSIDDEAEVQNRTVESFEFQGKRARWYQLSEGDWIFGAFLVGAD